MAKYHRVRMIDDDLDFGTVAGQELDVMPYWLDPEKWTVVVDGEPSHNIYRYQAESIREAK